MADADYSAFGDAPAPEDLKTLADMAKRLIEANLDVATKEEQLKTANETARRLSERDIPELMAKCGLKEFKTVGGAKLSVADDVHASITKANNAEAIAWLDEHGHSGIVKRSVFVDFGKADEKKAKALLVQLRKKFANVGEEANVHSSTLRAFVKGQLAEGKDIPLNLFGAVPYKKTTIKLAT